MRPSPFVPRGIDWDAEPLDLEPAGWIARRLGVTESTVRCARVQRGLPAPLPLASYERANTVAPPLWARALILRRFAPSLHAELLGMSSCAERLSYAAIASEVRLSPSVVHDTVHAAGIGPDGTRPRMRRPRRRHHPALAARRAERKREQEERDASST